MNYGSLISWGLRRALRVFVGLLLLFGALIVIGALTGANFSVLRDDFPERAILYWLITVPVALFYLVGAIIAEGFRRRVRQH